MFEGLLTCDDPCDDLVGKVGSNEYSGKTDTHLDPPEDSPQSRLQVPATEEMP